MNPCRLTRTAPLLVAASLLARAWAADPAPGSAFQTELTDAMLDPAAYAEWVDGREIPIIPKDERDRSASPAWLDWTQDTNAGHMGRDFGESKTPGARHLRVGFTRPVAIGTLIVGGDVRVGVLKPGASYPGNPGDDSQWLPAQRIEGRTVVTSELKDRGDFTTWILPPNTRAQAIRFTHTAKLTDKRFRGWVSSVAVLADRYVNIAPQARPVAYSTSERADRLNNESSDNFWGAWENISDRDGVRARTIEEEPESLMLIWPRAVSLRGISLQFPGFSAADLLVFKGADGTPPRDAPDSDWALLTTLSQVKPLYPMQVALNWTDFGTVVTTRALRLRLTRPVTGREAQGHLKARDRDGKRVWLGEWQALSPLGTGPLTAALPPDTTATPQPREPLIPVKFTLPEDGFVTLVIEDSTGKRVRNLVSETPFPKGANTAWWDGTDDLGRDVDASKHGMYHIPESLVAPGNYRVRGLWRKAIHSFYEFGVYSAGDPPWSTADNTGAWLSNHCAPMSAAFVPATKSPTGQPAMFLGCLLTEGPSGLAWVDLDGRKRGGKGWIGGNWTTAPYIAYDAGTHADPGVHLYVASVGEVNIPDDQKKKKKDREHIPELRLTALTAGQDRPLLRLPLTPPDDGLLNRGREIGGLAVRDGLIVCGLTRLNELLVLHAAPDASPATIVRTVKVDSPRGMAFDAQGRMLVISGTRVLRATTWDDQHRPDVVIDSRLEDPVGIALDGQGNLYISDRGASHQVKVFSPAGRFLRAIGKAGVPKAGPYDPLHMNNPRGLAVDCSNRLWVAEEDHVPKRVSLWTLDGHLVEAFYGPSKYGGGGTLDPLDRTLFYYADEGRGVMEFRLDWEKGTSKLINVLYRRNDTDLELPDRSAAPETPLYRETRGVTGTRKQRYFTNCYNSNPTGGSAAFLFIEKDHVLRPVAGMGQGAAWEDLFKKESLKGVVPAGIDFKNGYRNKLFYVWSDLNADGDVQADEIVCRPLESGGVTVLPDFSFCVARLGPAKEPLQAVRFPPVAFTDDGVPRYDIDKGERIAQDVQGPASSGGNQLLIDEQGNFFITLGVPPYHPYSISGGRNGAATWSYPNMWPGLHASHESPKPDRPGELVGTTRLVGGLFTPPHSDAGPLVAFTTSMGSLHIMTSDGLYVATPFQDCRIGDPVAMPVAVRGTCLDGMTLNGENFWPMITRSSDGSVTLVSGGNSYLIRMEGFDSIRRISPFPLTVTGADLDRARRALLEREAIRKREQGGGMMAVPLDAGAHTVDGKLDDWPTDWVEIDRSGAHAWFNANSKPYDIRGAVAVAGGRLYAAWQTADRNLLANTGDIPTAPFKTGGTLELMIGTDPDAAPARKEAAAGDLRLLVTLVKGKPLALLYRPVAPGTRTPRVPFSSPWRTVSFDRVDDVSSNVCFAADPAGNYEISIPLDVLGLKPRSGMRIRGDIGVLRGNGATTVARTYWSNKATGIVSDVPSEAELMPAFWGVWEFKSK